MRIRSMMCVPLLDHDGQSIGVIQMVTRSPGAEFTKEDLARYWADWSLKANPGNYTATGGRQIQFIVNSLADAWKLLADHHEKMEQVQMKELFSAQSDRFEKMSVRFEDLLLDYSKNIIT